MERLRLKIVQAGEPVLRAPARELTVEEILSPEVRNLVELMRETMHDAPGVGLAAPQIGISLRFAIIEDRPEYHRSLDPAALADRERAPVPFHVLFNPKITARSDETVAFYEGCLSVAGFSALVPRARRVTVEYLDETAAPQRLEASGWYARILQHEIDHLDGHLYLERMDPATFSTVENLTRYSNPAKPPK